VRLFVRTASSCLCSALAWILGPVAPTAKVRTPPNSNDSGLPVRSVSSRPQAHLAFHPETSSQPFPNLFRSLLLLIRRFERQPVQLKEGS
jgi:hypothetical protein